MQIVEKDVPTCGPTDRVAAIEIRTDVKRVGFCLVLNPDRVVLGRLRVPDMADAGDATAEQVMDPGPTSARADAPLHDLVGRMSETDVEDILVTDAEGVLIGVLFRADAEKRLNEA